MSASWRGHIGLIKPTRRGKSFAFWYKNIPRGIECAPAVIGYRSGRKDSFAAEGSFGRARDLCVELAGIGCDVLVVSGSPPFILTGPDYERKWRLDVEGSVGVPVVTGMAPHVVAARMLGVSRIAAATYYGSELNRGIEEYFGAFGIECVALPGLKGSANTEGLYTTSMRGLDFVSAEEVYKHCKRAVLALDEPVDGLYINGGGWDAGPVVGLLEEDLGMPVVWAMAAEMWLALTCLDISDPVASYGRILADPKLRKSVAARELLGAQQGERSGY